MRGAGGIRLSRGWANSAASTGLGMGDRGRLHWGTRLVGWASGTCRRVSGGSPPAVSGDATAKPGCNLHRDGHREVETMTVSARPLRCPSCPHEGRARVARCPSVSRKAGKYPFLSGNAPAQIPAGNSVHSEGTASTGLHAEQGESSSGQGTRPLMAGTPGGLDPWLDSHVRVYMGVVARPSPEGEFSLSLSPQ